MRQTTTDNNVIHAAIKVSKNTALAAEIGLGEFIYYGTQPLLQSLLQPISATRCSGRRILRQRVHHSINGV